MRLTSLYLCYQSVLEPLTQTQVIAYLEGLTQAGYRLVLLTFEPRSLTAEETQDHRKHLAAKGIAWHWLRYHKRPTVPATALDILAGIAVGWWLVWKYRIGLLHARIHVPGLMALALKSLTGAPFLFDIRGFMAEEYADAGVWKANGLLFRLTKWVQRRLVRAADGYVVLTQKARDLLQEWYPREIHGKPVQVIPCCIDLRRIPARNGRLGHPDEEKTLGYVGKLGGWYLTEEMAAFVCCAAGDAGPEMARVDAERSPTAAEDCSRRRDSGCHRGRLPAAGSGSPCLARRASGSLLYQAVPVQASLLAHQGWRIPGRRTAGGRPLGHWRHRHHPARGVAWRRTCRHSDPRHRPGKLS